jgi:outer membrane protein OmpU
MKNLRKVGLTALAGSLVAFSANAVELGVSGTAEVTYTTVGGSNSSTGNPWGSNTSVSFSGSGDVGFGTAKIVRTLNDGIATALSAWQTVDMGDLGTLSFDAIGGGLEGTTAYDDVLPTAYEEVWTGVSGTGVIGAASNDTLGYRNTIMGMTISLATSKGNTAGTAGATTGQGTGDGASDGVGVTYSQSDWHLSYAVPYVDGLTVSYGQSTKDWAVATENDDTSTVGHILYSTGPVSLGYRMAEFHDGSGGSNGTNIEAYAVAFNVSDEMKVSIATQDREYDVPSGTNVTETSDAINASYTSGAMTVRGTFAESKDSAGVTGNNDEHMELSLVLAF